MRLIPLASLLTASVLLAGCGGGSGDSEPVTVTLRSSTTLDGSVNSYGDVAPGDILSVGVFWTANTGSRGFVSFDLAAIPPRATVLSATMNLYQQFVVEDPYTALGTLLVDHVVYGGVLDSGAYDRAFPTGNGFGILSTDATLGYKALTVTDQVRADLAAPLSRSQFRVRWSVEFAGMGAQHRAAFGAGDSLRPNQFPTLVVTYRP